MQYFQEVINHIEAYNNTHAWIHEGVIYVDSMKYPRPFAEIARDNNCTFEVLHKETNEEILMGNEAHGLEFGGRKCICNVYKIEPIDYMELICKLSEIVRT